MVKPRPGRLGPTLAPDPRRVVVKLFVPGEDAALVRSRAATLIDRVALLGPEETARLLRETLRRFGDRHGDLEATFLHHYDMVRHRVPGQPGHHVDLPTAEGLQPDVGLGGVFERERVWRIQGVVVVCVVVVVVATMLKESWGVAR